MTGKFSEIFFREFFHENAERSGQRSNQRVIYNFLGLFEFLQNKPVNKALTKVIDEYMECFRGQIGVCRMVIGLNCQ
jgi:hypothetical protein